MIFVLGIVQYSPVLGSIWYYAIFVLGVTVIPSTDTAQTYWQQWCGSCQQTTAGRLGRR